MPSPAIDRQAWAAVVAALIEEETDGNKTRFSAMIGVDRKTVTRWLAANVSVSEESVRAVARKLGIQVADLLRKVGYYSEADLPERQPEPSAAESQDDEAIELIRRSDAPPSLKRELIAHLAQQREEHQRQRLAEAQRMLDLAQRGRRRPA